MEITRCHLVLGLLLTGFLAVTGCGKDSVTGTGGGGGTPGVSASIVGSVPLPDAGSGIHVAGDHAYVAASSEGLQVVNVSDPTSPSIVTDINSIFTSGGVAAVTAGSTTILYMSARTTGFHAVNISAPLSPVVATTINTPAIAMDVALTTTASPVLCVADGASGIQFYYGSSGNSSFNTPEIATSVAATDVYCFVTDVPDGIGIPSPALHVINLSDRTSPSLARTLPLGGSPAGIAIKGNYAYVAAGDPGMYVIDISTPTSPSIAGQTSALSATGPIAVDATRMLVYLGTTDTAGFPSDGLKIIDVSTAGSPRVIDTVDLPDWTTGVAALGDYVYVVTDVLLGSGASSLHIVDIGDF